MKRNPTTKISRDAILRHLESALICCLEVNLPDGTHKIVELFDKPVTIGRDPNCTIPLAFDDVSWNHAVIELRNEEYFIRDLDSTNGTFLNRIRIVESVLRQHDKITVGNVILVFVDRGLSLQRS